MAQAWSAGPDVLCMSAHSSLLADPDGCKLAAACRRIRAAERKEADRADRSRRLQEGTKHGGRASHEYSKLS